MFFNYECWKIYNYIELFYNFYISLLLIINVNIKDNIIIINSEDYALSSILFIPKNLTNILFVWD